MRRATLFLILIAAAPASAQEQPSAKQLSTGSRARFTHRINLYDERGVMITPPKTPDAKPDPKLPPYSPMHTCGKCHLVDTIAHGWHFNAADPTVNPGRPGEPWILSDKDTQTQLPISARGWPGTFKPEALGMSAWAFTTTFGPHSPGGGLGDTYANQVKIEDKDAKWDAVGHLEIDCLHCHSANPSHDQAEWTKAVSLESFQWAPTIAAGLGHVTAPGRSLQKPKPTTGPASAENRPSLPLQYNPDRFDETNKVFLDITRAPGSDRCYYCHSTREVGPGATQRWLSDQDIHLRAGFTCVDCHRTDISHRDTRGYEGEQQANPNAPAGLTCKGCHLGDAHDDAWSTALSGGRLGAPRPTHNGLPPIHFQKLTCTACHAGPWPQENPRAVQTSLAHNLGLETRDRADDELPHVIAPVFMHNAADGRVAPHRLLWPSYFARLKDNTITPILPGESKPLLRAVKRKAARAAGGAGAKTAARPNAASSPPATDLTAQEAAMLLADLTAKDPKAGEAVFVRDGRIYRKQQDKDELTPISDARLNQTYAQPYAWPLAHDVRPASQSMGIRGCTDCHAANSAFNAGGLASPFDKNAAALPLQTQSQLRNDNARMLGLWGWSYSQRSYFKMFAYTATILLAILLFRYLLLALGGALRRIA